MLVAEKLRELEIFADQTFTPIIKEDSWTALNRELTLRQPLRILEIGTAIGYSAIKILDVLPNAQLTTLEIRRCRAIQAQAHLHDVGLDGRATMLLIDAEMFLKDCEENRFDMIFLDGAKAQYAKYLPYLIKILTGGGWIFADNLNFDGRVQQVLNGGLLAIPRKHRAAVKSLIAYRNAVADEPFSSVFLDVGDGVAISVKHERK